MQANAQISSLQFDRRQDFYSALLQTGFTAMTAASEAVYLNERQKVQVAKWTWIEEERMNELELSDNAMSETSRSGFTSHLGEEVSAGSGYARQKSPLGAASLTADVSKGAEMDAVGFLRRLQRFGRASSFMGGVFWLLIDLYRVLASVLLEKVGITRRPRWLETARLKQTEHAQAKVGEPPKARSMDFWMLSNEGVLSLPTDLNVDVEEETKRRLAESNESRQPPTEEQLSVNLYEWWKHGGWWGEKDISGSYAPSIQDDDDATSIITSTTCDEWEDLNASSSNSGQTTPTNLRPYTDRSRSSSPTLDSAIDPAHLASLLDPQDLASRQEAKMLAQRLTSPTVVTRSQFRYAQKFAHSKLLTSTRYRPDSAGIPSTGKLSAAEEAQLLEHLIISRRSQASSARDERGNCTSWRAGGPGLGSGGPQCVVCQSSPRTVLAWPCRCLSLCEDCRAGGCGVQSTVRTVKGVK
ncbi:uncharacterized protein KY384_007805 [Bacidia gigantensis]|uniref:uncharacterized protein n=1 Tax=Bacidia gigantensis TaxID=2732470 RepID=UPI001D04D7A6|nr:uncharacterized protein KY384_007805 [Bacidia gigantensis]KAG8527652.1 hypothetical protein KY384_007805 [Bacidia gigantensis]